jgi:hypothetical protein
MKKNILFILSLLTLPALKGSLLQLSKECEKIRFLAEVLSSSSYHALPDNPVENLRKCGCQFFLDLKKDIQLHTSQKPYHITKFIYPKKIISHLNDQEKINFLTTLNQYLIPFSQSDNGSTTPLADNAMRKSLGITTQNSLPITLQELESEYKLRRAQLPLIFNNLPPSLPLSLLPPSRPTNHDEID